MDKKNYIKPTSEIVAFASILADATIGMGSIEEEFGNAKENPGFFDFDDDDPWADDPWADTPVKDLWEE